MFPELKKIYTKERLSAVEAQRRAEFIAWDRWCFSRRG